MSPEPTSDHELAHDVLAAEEFVVPAPDPALHHGPVQLPDDPTGIAEAHDVLAAEEFALPAPPPGAGADDQPRAEDWRRRAATALAGAGLALLAARRLRRRRAA